MHVPTWIYFLVFIGLLIGNVKVYQTIFAKPVLTVSVLEAGKTHATLVRSPNNKTLLIDTGPDASILRALGSALPMWQRKIDAVILTSTKSTFTGGLPEVQSRYRVSSIMHVDGADIPYGAPLIFDGSRITIISPGTLFISYGTSVFRISSSTPTGIYISNGETIFAK